jgi:DNA-binding NtrC family response regulator
MSISLPRRKFGNKLSPNTSSSPTEIKNIWESEPILQLIYGLQQGNWELVTEVIEQASWLEEVIYKEIVKVWQGNKESATKLPKIIDDCKNRRIRNWSQIILSLYWLEEEDAIEYRNCIGIIKQRARNAEEDLFVVGHRKTIEIMGRVKFAEDNKEEENDKDIETFEELQLSTLGAKHLEGLRGYVKGITKSNREVKLEALNQAVEIFSKNGESPNLYWWSKALAAKEWLSEEERLGNLKSARNGLLETGREQEAERVNREIAVLEKKYVRQKEIEGYLFTGKSEEILKKIESFASSSSPVLILGETGVGKSVIAKVIHDHPLNERRHQAFVEVNCGTLNKELAGVQLFGSVRGAYTGAENSLGLLSKVGEGTIFLDEIGELDPTIQAMLLSVIEQKRFRKVGSFEEIVFKGRIIAATNRNIISNDTSADKVHNPFRADLLWRLRKNYVEIAPLRDRKEEIVPLAKHLLAKVSKGRAEFAPLAAEELEKHRFGGNIRELQNIIEKLVLGAKITYAESQKMVITQPAVEQARKECSNDEEVTEVGARKPGKNKGIEKILAELIMALHKEKSLDMDKNLDWITTEMIKAVMKLTNGNVRETARVLNKSRTQLYRLMNKYNIRENEIN